MHETYLSICTNELLKKAVCYIRHNYQTDININDIAEYASISERYLRKLFSQNLNLSPLDYLNQIRINKSIELLKNTEKSVKEVCFLCGFQSPQYFSRIFKQQMHSRRMEAYFYFEVPEDQAVCHFMGEVDETRHIWMKGDQAVLSPEWSIHSAAATHNYTFIWGMGGENLDYGDQDFSKITDLK